ncbi:MULTISPECIES: glycoside hydrolase family 13 protein [unclassified Streptomyces]|uniref:glycoside hydrolase family 13 protein n=1 Tax=unclassified Streptomyces TaxID=2593676 RepID=UPI000DC7BF50|nr:MULTISPECIES: glycoside hydrolase family 13 protein [unclassified Streptomyces]AWZ03956.1 alpha-glucosidase [Streptomyces sp. ICC4]AWZ11468.1 alpha-glucosidase [Streptomyces sp. ICC1]
MTWWRHSVCYEVYPRSFADSDGDGTGDLPGVTEHLDHLSDLGADAVWITPCYPSPLADGGYDIADYTGISPDLGTLDDFDTLTERAHDLGLKVIVDLVPNHTSDSHPWFRDALATKPGSAARDRYLLRPGKGPGGSLPPNDWQSAFGGPAWTRIDAEDHWYLHLHAPEQPDLNWRNPQVRSDFTDVLRFWLDRGVDGFRVDVAHALFKAQGLPDAGPGQHRDPLRNHLMPYYDQEELHPLYREWRTLLDTHPAPPGAVDPKDRVMVAESAVFAPDRLARYVRPDEMQQAFNFAFLEAPWQAQALRRVIDDSLAATASVGAPVAWVLSSHDAVRPVTRYGSELRARSAALLMLALPGAVCLYQGEELGLPQASVPDDRIRDPLWERSGHTDRGRDGARAPIPWSGSRPPYGFTTASPDDCWLPQPQEWDTHTVEAQRADPHSTLSLYRSALRLRRDHPADTHSAALRWHSAPADSFLAFQRGDLACAVNLGPDPLPLDTLGLPGRPAISSAPLRGRTLPPDAAVWLSTTQECGDSRD